MMKTRFMRVSSLLSALALAGCGSLDVTNPNAPDAKRALSDPAALEAVAGGTLRTWFNAYDGCEGNCVLVTQAQTYSASWNNWNMNFYSSYNADGKRLDRAYQNDPASAGRTSIEVPWSGMYTTISSASDVLKAIRVDNVVINDVADTKRAEAIAELTLGMSLSYIALNYDKGYIVDETIDVTTLQYSNRKQMRDAAIAKLQSAATIAGANTFTTPAAWTNGRSYTSAQIKQIANTMSAITLAYYPRNAAENAAVNWAQVLTYTNAGMSSGTAFDFVFVGDGCNAFCHEVLLWFQRHRRWSRAHPRCQPARSGHAAESVSGGRQPWSRTRPTSAWVTARSAMPRSWMHSRRTRRRPTPAPTSPTPVRKSSVRAAACTTSRTSATSAST